MVSGAGPYADDWHDFPATSARTAEIVAELGYTVEISDDVDEALSRPNSRLVIVNIGRAASPRTRTTAEAVRTGLAEHLTGGGALLGMHSTITSMTDLPDWRRSFGGAWIQGRTMHPPKGPATLRRTGTDHPVSADSPTISVIDERYSYLETEPDIDVLYTHQHDDLSHPVVWARRQGEARVVYDALGHDTTSFDSPDHRALLRRAVAWLLRRS